MGVFAVKLETEGGKIVAQLTGEHFTDDELDIARAVVGASIQEAMQESGSPVYLVRDSVVDIAVRMSERVNRSAVSDCHAGNRGKPCGVCATCLAARREMFTWTVIGRLELPESVFARHVVHTLQSTLGIIWTDGPWNDKMDEEAVARVFDIMGVSPRKENEDETH